MKQITEGVYFIQGQDEMIPDSHMYVVGKPSSADLTLIDAGLMGKGQYKIESIQKLGLDLSDVKRVIMSHTHLDHIGCLSEILKENTQAELWVHIDEAEPLEKGDERTVYGMDMFKNINNESDLFDDYSSITSNYQNMDVEKVINKEVFHVKDKIITEYPLSLYGMDMFKNMCQAQYGLKSGDFGFQVDRKLKGGETLEIGDMVWEVIHVPGHSPGSIALYNRQEKILIPGDVVYADYAIGRFDLHGASGAQHRESLFTLAELEVNILLPGHNQVVIDLPPGYILETAKQWEPYLK